MPIERFLAFSEEEADSPIPTLLMMFELEFLKPAIDRPAVIKIIEELESYGYPEKKLRQYVQALYATHIYVQSGRGDYGRFVKMFQFTNMEIGTLVWLTRSVQHRRPGWEKLPLIGAIELLQKHYYNLEM